MNNRSSVFFRCDAGTGYGFGHLMRCISLAQAFHRSGIEKTAFLVRNPSRSDLFEKLLAEKGLDCIYLPEDSLGLGFDFKKYIRPGLSNILIFDNYDVTADQMRAYKEKYKNLVAIDDLADRKFSADIIINQNLGAGSLKYDTASDAVLLMGPSFTMLRSSILEAKTGRGGKERRDNPRIFMSFGGGNVLDRIRGILEILVKLDRLLQSQVHIDFAISNDAQLADGISRYTKGLINMEIHLIAGKYELAGIINNADFALTAAGTSVFELAYLGIPQIAVMIDGNQEVTGRKINEIGFGVCLGFAEGLSEKEFTSVFMGMLKDKAMRKKMSIKGQNFIDGKGADRVVHEIVKHYQLSPGL